MSSRVASIHRTRIQQIEAEASALAGAMTKVSQQCQEVLSKGGTLQIQPQMAFAVGAVARVLKDEGVVEQLQADGVVLRPPAK